MSLPGGGLRIRIVADNAVRRAGLAAIVAAAGHRIADASDEADVVLADGAAAEAMGPPVVMLGGDGAGHAGVLSADATPAQVDAALRAVAAGLIVRAVGDMRPAFRRAPGDEAPPLTPREVEVLAALGDGLSNKEIARRLAISHHTVKFHLEALFRKLDASSRAEAVHKGLRQGLIEL